MGRKAHATQLHLDHGPRRLLDQGPANRNVIPLSKSGYILTSVGILRELGGKLFTVNGVEDHIHLLLQGHGISPDEKYLWT